MLFAELRKEIISPDEEIIIGKYTKYNNKIIYFIALTIQDKSAKLWVMEQTEHIDEDEDMYVMRENCTTNRESMLLQNKSSKRVNTFTDLNINGIDLKVQGSEGSNLWFPHPVLMKIPHFIEKGVDFSLFDDIPLNELMLYCYNLDLSEIPEKLYKNDICISAKLNNYSVKTILNTPIKFSLGLSDNYSKEYSFYDYIEGKSINFRINKIYINNILELFDRQAKDENTIKALKSQGMSEEEIKEFLVLKRQEIINSLPMDKYDVLIEYEAENDIQLNFYTTEYLERQPAASTSFHTYLSHGGENGIYGAPARLCLLTQRELDFDGVIEFELFSFCRHFIGDMVGV